MVAVTGEGGAGRFGDGGGANSVKIGDGESSGNGGDGGLSATTSNWRRQLHVNGPEYSVSSTCEGSVIVCVVENGC